MTKNLLTTNKNDCLVDCAKVFNNNSNSISSLIVVEEKGEAGQEKVSLVGMELFTSTEENCAGLALVKDYMSHPVYTISIRENVSGATKLMLDKHVS